MKNTTLPLVINWHSTAVCNFSCQGCYSEWHNHQSEAWNNPSNVRKIIENIAKFHKDHFGETAAPWRLSIVGGEPSLFKDKIQFVAKTAHAYGAEVSVISNGSHLENIFPFARLLSQVGVSLDSFSHETNLKIGRHCHGKTLSYEEIASKLATLRAINPKIHIKVNTVVNQNNYNELLVDKVAALGASKYKILRQIPFGCCKGVTDEQFFSFLRNNYREDLFASGGAPSQHIFVEDNAAMLGSYLMIAPDGRLFQNGQAEYRYSQPLMNTPFEVAMKEVGFAEDKFFNRYTSVATDATIAKMKLASAA